MKTSRNITMTSQRWGWVESPGGTDWSFSRKVGEKVFSYFPNDGGLYFDDLHSGEGHTLRIFKNRPTVAELDDIVDRFLLIDA